MYKLKIGQVTLITICTLAVSCSQIDKQIPEHLTNTSARVSCEVLDNQLRAGVKSVWMNDPFDHNGTVEAVASKIVDTDEGLPSMRATEADDIDLNELLRVADKVVEVCPADFTTSKEYSDAMDCVIYSEGRNLTSSQRQWLHVAAVTASEATFLKYGTDMNALKLAWTTSKDSTDSNNQLRAFEPFGEREVNAFSHMGSMIKDWWRSHDCARGIISSAMGSAIGNGIFGGPGGVVAGAIGGAIGGALGSC